MRDNFENKKNRRKENYPFFAVRLLLKKEVKTDFKKILENF